MVFLVHIREVHTYNSAPYVSMLVGLGIGTLIEDIYKKLKLKKIIVVSFLVLIFIIEIVSIELRISRMKVNGERAWILIEQILPYIENVPANGNLILVNPINKQVEYSNLIMNDFNVLLTGLTVFNELSERKDFQPLIINLDEVYNFSSNKNNLLLHLEGSKVKKFE